MAGNIYQRPKTPSRLDLLAGVPERPSPEAKKQISAEPHRFARLVSPREGLEQPQPSGFQPRDIASAHSEWDQLLFDLLKARLGGRGRSCIQLFEPFPPPGETDGPEHRLLRGAHDVAHRPVDGEERSKRSTVPDRNVG